MSTHLILLYGAAAPLDREALLRHWEQVRRPWARCIPGVARYLQDLVLNASDGHDEWFGAEEFWLDGAASAAQLRRALAVQDAADRAAAVPGAGVAIPLWTDDHVVLAGTPITRGELLPKRMTFLRRKPGLDREAVLHYWRHSHGPLAASVPGVRRYVQSSVDVTADDAGWRQAAPRIEGVAQIWIDNVAALRDIVASPLFRERVKPDEANFVDSGTTFTLAVRELDYN